MFSVHIIAYFCVYLRVRSNTSSRTGIVGGAKFYSVRLVVLAVLHSVLELLELSHSKCKIPGEVDEVK